MKTTKPTISKDRNDFLLPDELGWKCNDEISKLIDEWTEYLATFVKKYPDNLRDSMFWEVAKAQLMDDIYAVIKKYQSVTIRKPAKP